MKKLSLYVFLVLMVLINISYSGEKKIESAFGIKLGIPWIAYAKDIEKWNPDWCEENTISIYDKELTKELSKYPQCVEFTDPPKKNKLFSKYYMRFLPVSGTIYVIYGSGTRKSREECELDLDFLKEELSSKYYSTKKIEYYNFGHIKGFTIFQQQYKILVGCGDFDDKDDYDLHIKYKNDDGFNLKYIEEEHLIKKIKSKKSKNKDKSGL